MNTFGKRSKIKEHTIKDKILVYLSPNEIGLINDKSSFALATKLETERYVISTLLDHMQADGFVTNIETSSKMDGGLGGKIATITPHGLYFLHKGGYTSVKKQESLQRAWTIVKIIAAVLNALLIISIAIWGVTTQIDANKKSTLTSSK